MMCFLVGQVCEDKVEALFLSMAVSLSCYKLVLRFLPRH